MTSKRRLSGRKKTILGLTSLATGLFVAGQTSSGFGQSPIWMQTSAPNMPWRCMAVSADGSRVVAVAGGSEGPYPQIVGPIYTSTNSGTTWNLTSAPIASWNSVAASSDGRRLAAVIAFGAIYTSTNFGVTWTATTAPSADWQSIASSGDGKKLVAVELCIWPPCDSSTAAIYTSADGGATWSHSISVYTTFSVASSADGSHLAAASGGITISTNAGATWALSGAPYTGYEAVASSWDGNRLVAVSPGRSIVTSTDAGSTWIQSSSPGSWWWSVCSSANGSTLLAGASYDSVSMYSSSNSGSTWISNSAPTGVQWKALASSADGNKLFAAVNGGGIYTYQIAPALTITGTNNNSVVSWPDSATGYTLQQNPHLHPTNWVTVTNIPISDGMKKEVIIPQTVDSMFFRLVDF
jgi:hypothetical protein